MMSLETLLACRPQQYAERAVALRRLAESLGRVERSLTGTSGELSGSRWRGHARQRAGHQQGRLRESVGTAARMAMAASEVLSWYGETMQALQARARSLPATVVPAGASPQAVQAAQVAATEQQRILAEAAGVDGHAARRLGYLGSGHLTRRLDQVPGMPRITPPAVTGGRPWQVRPPRAGWQDHGATSTIKAGGGGAVPAAPVTAKPAFEDHRPPPADGRPPKGWSGAGAAKGSGTATEPTRAPSSPTPPKTWSGGTGGALTGAPPAVVRHPCTQRPGAVRTGSPSGADRHSRTATYPDRPHRTFTRHPATTLRRPPSRPPSRPSSRPSSRSPSPRRSPSPP